MTSDVRPSWLLSEQELFNWLQQQPRTYGWQVLIALDRTKVNALLLQEYIARYARDGYLAPITDTVLIDDGPTHIWEHLYEHVLGPPRLSFENSDSDEWARVTLPILGGVQVTVERAGMAPKQVTRVSWYEPLQAPRLIAEIRLADTAGEVNYSGEVALDLSQGTRFRVTYGCTQRDQAAGGTFYEELFKLLDPAQQRFVLGTLEDFAESDLLCPDKFRLRTLCAKSSADGRGGGTQEGALLLFVGTKGNPAGSGPDSGAKWAYPIPAGRSSTMLLSNDALVKGLLLEGVRAGSSSLIHALLRDEATGAYVGLRLLSGWVRAESAGEHIPGFGNVTVRGSFAFNFQVGQTRYLSFELVRQGEELEVVWGHVTGDEYAPALVGAVDGSGNQAVFGVRWNIKQRYRFGLNDAGGVFLSPAAPADMDVRVLEGGEVAPPFAPHAAATMALIKRVSERTMAAFLASISEGAVELELFRLYGLLFNASRPVTHQSVRLPCDLAIFGDIAPSRTTFQLEPAVVDMLPGNRVQFLRVPMEPGLAWILERVPGFDNPIGSISQDGIYTAPAEDALPPGRGYAMVRVVAHKQNMAGSALVRIVRRSIVVNPMVVVAAQNATMVRFSGGSVLGGSLTWGLQSATGATLSATPPDVDGMEFDDGDMFYIPGSGATGQHFSIETISVGDSAGNTATAHLVLLEKDFTGRVVIVERADLPEGKIQLGLDTLKEIITSDADWSVIAGGGSIDADGVYTVDSVSTYKYSVVAAVLDLPYVYFTGYLILPIPLIDLDEVKRVIA